MKHTPPEIKPQYFGNYDCVFEQLEPIFGSDQEVTVIVTLDRGCFKINDHIISVGGLNYALTDMKILFNRILIDKASRFLFAHNHTNGMPEFSREDYELTIALKYMSRILEIDFMDHILFPYKREPVSMKQVKPSLFERDWMEIFQKNISRYCPKK